METRILADADAVAREAAGVIAAEARTAVAARGRFIVAVSGGHTPWLMLRALAGEDVPWAGIREHAMGAVVNGLSLSKLRGYASTFFIFSDYARPAMRLSALMELPTIFIFTHDAMGDGEDGPTHQPVEHLASLRAIPGLVTLRPGDANEVVEAYR